MSIVWLLAKAKLFFEHPTGAVCTEVNVRKLNEKYNISI